MNDQLPMFDPMTCKDSGNAISSPESESGVTPSGSPAGPTTAKSGQGAARASRSARPEKPRRSTTKGIYGQSSFVSSRHEDLSSALASRFRASTDSLGSTLCKLTWTVRITPSGFSIPALRASELPTGGSVCIGWPTPRAAESGPDYAISNRPENAGMSLPTTAALAGWPTVKKRDYRSENEASLQNGPDLNKMVLLAGWPTPMAQTPAQNGYNEAGNSDSSRKTVELCRWKTPCVPNGGRISGNPEDIGAHQNGTKAQIGLENEAKLSGWQTPHCPRENDSQVSESTYLGREAQLTAFGETPIGFLLGPNGWEIIPASGQLNAAHSRWLMGLPKEWDDCGVTAMASLRKSRKPS